MSICDKIDRLNRAFIWRSDVTKRKLHLVSWNKIVKPKSEGGLNLKEARKSNIALLSKVGWRVFKNDDAKWAKIYRKKYLKNDNFLGHVPKATAAPTWKGIFHSFNAVQSRLRWVIGNGRQVSVWHEEWAGPFKFEDLVENPIPDNLSSLKVENLISESRNWDLRQIEHLLSPDLCAIIHGIPIPLAADVDDFQGWADEHDKAFSCKSAYQALRLPGLVENRKSWETLWGINCPQKLLINGWLMLHKAAMLNANRFDRGCAVSDLCPRCSLGREDERHLLWDCKYAKEIWNMIIAPTDWMKFRSIADKPGNCFENLMLANFRNCVAKKVGWGSVFIVTVWNLWCSRNRKVFDGLLEPPLEIFRRIESLVKETLSTNWSKSQTPLPKKNRSDIMWTAPEPGWCKLNCDGSLFKEVNSAAMGGVVRDDSGNWIFGFASKLEVCSINVAELLTLREGLRLAWDRRIPKLHIELDSAVVVSWVKEGLPATHPLYLIVKDVMKLLEKPWLTKLEHNFREANEVADALAKNGHHLSYLVTMFDSPPDCAREEIDNMNICLQS